MKNFRFTIACHIDIEVQAENREDAERALQNELPSDMVGGYSVIDETEYDLVDVPPGWKAA